MRHVEAKLRLGGSYREGSLVQFDKDLSPHSKVLIQNGIGDLMTGHGGRGLLFVEDVTHSSPHANRRSPKVLWMGFVHPRCLGQMLCKALSNPDILWLLMYAHGQTTV